MRQAVINLRVYVLLWWVLGPQAITRGKKTLRGTNDFSKYADKTRRALALGGNIMNSVSSISPVDSTYSSPSADNADSSGPAKTSAPKTAAQDDVKLKLSESAQVQALYSQGETVSEIAQYLECPTTVIDGYLGITTTQTAGSGTANGTSQYSPSQVAQPLPKLP
jgi:hypothetical protein